MDRYIMDMTSKLLCPQNNKVADFYLCVKHIQCWLDSIDITSFFEESLITWIVSQEIQQEPKTILNNNSSVSPTFIKS